MKKKYILIFALSFIVFTLVFSVFGRILSTRDSQTIATGEDDEGDFGPMPKPEQKVKNELLFLLVGVDAKDVKKSKGTRTDTMMLVKVNFDTGSTKLLSIPRDTRVLIKGKEDKINHAHSNGGINLTIPTVSDFLNLEIDYYVKVDYKAVISIVDAIGNVVIDVPRRMYYDDPTDDPPLHINLKKGIQELDGKNAHDFLRWRKNNDNTGYPDGDIGRIKAQQMFLTELMKQTLKPKNIFKIPKLIETYYDYVETNIPLKIMLKGAASAKKINIEELKTATIPGDGKTIKGVSYWIYDKEETDEIVKEMFGDYLLGQ